MSFFNDLMKLTPIQHLVEYWFIWGLFVVILFIILIFNNKKNPK